MLRCHHVALAALASFASACTVIQLDTRTQPAGFEANGLVDGHVALGISGETTPLRMQVLDGSSSGAIFELVIWKLFRFELGVAGVDIGIGPLDAGLGVLFYEPSLPPQPPPKPKSPPAQPPTPAASPTDAPSGS